MGKTKLNELAVRAAKNELTTADINTLVLVLVDNEREQDEAIKKLRISDKQHGRKFKDIEEEYPLLPSEADDLSNAVRKKGVEVLGGKKSGAYQNKEVRQRVYRDIYGEIKRQYGLEDETGRQLSYKKLKRKYLKGALAVVSEYVLPIALENEVLEANEVGEIED